MDREEKKKTDSVPQDRPVHRRPRRPEGGTARRAEGSTVKKPEGTAPARRTTEGSAAKKPEGAVPRRRPEGSTARKPDGTAPTRRTEGGAGKKPEGAVPRRRSEGSTARKTDGTAPTRRAEGSAVKKREGATSDRRTEGSAARKQEGAATVRRTEESAARKPDRAVQRRTDRSTLRRPEDSSMKRERSTSGKRRPSAAAEELRKNSQGNSQRKGQGGSHQPARGSSKKKQQKRAQFNIISSVVLVAAVCVFVFSLYQLIAMLVPYYSGGKIYDEIKDIAITADENGEGFKVDFDALLKENSDTVAWIRFDEPEIINYPVVKSADNADYLTKTFTANDNKLGAIFMDYRNSNDFSDRNTFIYGHHLNVGGEMFSELLEYESESFCKEHPNFYIYTPDGKVRTYTVFSAGVVKDTADNYKIDYASDADFEEYLKLCQDSSNYTVDDVELNAQSQIVSLSTCTNVRDDERFLVQGVLTATD